MQSCISLDTVKICSKTDIEENSKRTHRAHRMSVKMMELGYLRVEIEWQSK